MENSVSESQEPEQSTPKAWFEFRIEDTEGLGVEIEKLTRVLQDLSSAFHAIAVAKLGMPNRRGPRTSEEQTLASIRIVSVSVGSAVIEADPPAVGAQPQLAPLVTGPTVDDVALDLLDEMRRLDARERSRYTRPDVRRHVQRLIKSAGAVGRTAEAIHRPKHPVGNILPGGETRAKLSTRVSPIDVTPVVTQPRTRRLAGHAYMVDVEPGRQRLRLKLPDGRDLTVDASPEIAAQMKGAVDQVVEIESVEEMIGDLVSSRTATRLTVLPSSGDGSDKPPKSIQQLAEEQGMPDQRPDYEALASAVWEREEDLVEFDDYIRQLRGAGLATT
jgi:hypothetical protein